MIIEVKNKIKSEKNFEDKIIKTFRNVNNEKIKLKPAIIDTYVIYDDKLLSPIIEIKSWKNILTEEELKRLPREIYQKYIKDWYFYTEDDTIIVKGKFFEKYYLRKNRGYDVDLVIRTFNKMRYAGERLSNLIEEYNKDLGSLKIKFYI